MRGLSRATACACALASAVALADASEGVRLDYEVDGRCPPADTFVSEVHARSPRVRFSSDAARTLVVRIEPHGGKLVGRIELGTTQRAVTGATCDEVISALGLVTALALDPLATTSASEGDGGSASTNGNGNGSASTNGNGSGSADAGASARAGAGEDAGSARDAKGASEDERELPVEERKWSFAAGADAEVVVGAAPDPIFAVPVFFEVARALGPHFGLGGALRFAHAGETALAGGVGADFDWTAGSVDLCAVFRAGRVRLDGCERSAFGVIEADGLGVLPSRSVTRPWISLGLALSLRVRIAGAFFVEAAGHLGASLERDRFFLEPNQTVFQAPALTGEAGGGIGFEIW